MAFSNETIEKAWERSGGYCECRRVACGHSASYTGQCTQRLLKYRRGDDSSAYGWEAHHRTAVSKGGSDSLSNCEILCMRCHKETDSFGRH